jgi:hypothetical protein
MDDDCSEIRFAARSKQNPAFLKDAGFFVDRMFFG